MPRLERRRYRLRSRNLQPHHTQTLENCNRQFFERKQHLRIGKPDFARRTGHCRIGNGLPSIEPVRRKSKQELRNARSHRRAKYESAHVEARGIDYTVLESCRLQLDFSWTRGLNSSLSLLVVAMRDGRVRELFHSHLAYNNIALLWGSEKVEMDVNKGEIIRITLRRTMSGFLDGTVTCNVDISIIAGNVVPEGGKLYFSNNLGFETWFDCFKAIVKLFGLFVLVDGDKKTVRMIPMREL